MMSKTYFLVIYDVAHQKGVSAAKKSIISEHTADLLLADKGRPTITRKEDGSKYLVIEKRLFEMTNTDGNKILFLVCDCEKQKS